MIVPHGDQQLGSTAAGGLASFGASVVGDNMATITIPMDLDVATVSQQSCYSTQGTADTHIQDAAAQIPQETYHSLFGYDSFNAIFDSPMSFRDRHRFLDGVYNSCHNPGEMPAKELESISQSVGLSMEEVLSWFDDEKERRAKLLTSSQHWSAQSGHQFPLSPASTTTPGPNSTVTLSMTQFSSTSTGTFSPLQDILSPPLALSPQRLPVPFRGKRGRPAKHQSSVALDPPSTESKRQKTSVEYPCPDCGRSFAAERWSEHVKRVHFPDQVWVCQKTNEKSGKVCSSNPFFRPDNFATHLKGEHCCNDLEISRLKAAWKFRVVNFFHHICGLCDDILESRDESIEHIKHHFRDISQRPNPPEDLGVSHWKEKCGSDHKLKRGVHYHVNKIENGEVSDRDRDHDDSDGPNQGNPANPNHDNSRRQPDKRPNPDGDSGSGNDGSFCSSKTSGHMECRQHSTASSYSCAESPNDSGGASLFSSFGLEGLSLPFTSLRKLGSGGHGLVDEVMSTAPKEIFARKSVLRKSVELPTSSQMAHLKNELAVLKELSHPHLVKLIGAYTDAEYSHIIMSPVADQNLADYMRSSTLSQPKHLLQWMGCLSSAMAYLHNRQVQHLDVKPQNILVKGHSIFLADFGTAKSFFNEDPGNVRKLTLTPMYCAPETMLHGRQDYSTDIFSLGCVFSEMITLYFGRSLQDFEDFRSKTVNKAFYLTVSETQDWVQQLPENGVPSLLILPEPGWAREVLPKIIDMLAEITTDRPRAKDMHAFFNSRDQCRCSSCDTIERGTLGPKICQSKISQKLIVAPNNTRSDRHSVDQQYPSPSLRTLPSVPMLSSATSSAQESDLVDNTCSVLPCHLSIVDQNAYMLSRHEDNDFTQKMYAQGIYGFESMQGYLDAAEYTHPPTSQDSYPGYSSFAVEPIYPEPQQGVNGKSSPPLYPVESPELRPPPSNLTTSSGPSAPSSTMSTPYMNDGQTIPVLERNSIGLGINPRILGGGFDGFQDFSYKAPCMEHELAFTDVTKSHVFVDPSVIHQYTGMSVQAGMRSAEQIEFQPHHMYPSAQSPTPSNHSARSSQPIKRSQSIYLNAYQTYPHMQRRPSLMSHASYGSQDGSFDSDNNREKGRCPNPECGKVFKDLKAHMLTHQNERPEKCPIVTCDYHIKGFARKYDKNRHTLTHYKGTMVCGFCPSSGSLAEKFFNRADVFKRHLISVHAVEQTPPNSQKKTSRGVSAGKKLAGYAPDATGKCSTCSAMFQNAQDFYEHLDDCVLRIVQQYPTEDINTQEIAEFGNGPAVHKIPCNNTLTKVSQIPPSGSVQELQSSHRLTHSEGGANLPNTVRKKRKDYPASWGCPTAQMKTKKRVLCAFDGPRRLWKDDMMLSTDYEVRILQSDKISYVTDLDVQTLRRAEALFDATDGEKGPYEDEMDLEKLMAIRCE